MAFDREVSIDLTWLESKAVLHVVDIDTHFSAASFLKQRTVEAVWDAFVSCWASL